MFGKVCILNVNITISSLLRCNGLKLFLSLLVIAVSILLSETYKVEDNHETKTRLTTNPEWSRRRSKSSECRLGGVRYALNSTWSPDLGPPFGVWNCVKCSCSPVRRKKRIVAKIMCKNIKDECPPKPPCSAPILPPGACCKVCPEEGTWSSSEHVQEEESDTQSLSGRDFAVLLNGRTSLSPLTTKQVATGRMFLRRGTLHFSFLVDSSSSASDRMTVRFLNDKGSILEEIETRPTPYEVNNGRICGTWTRVPRQYRAVLLKEQMWVSLIPNSVPVKDMTDVKSKAETKPVDDEEFVSGRITRFKGVNTEVFSSLLTPVENHPNQTLPSGGTAIISVSAPSDSLHVSLVFNGIFRRTDETNITLVVELSPSKNIDPVQESVVLKKVFSDVNQVEVLTTLGKTSLRLLTRGKVKLKIWSESAPEYSLEGLITSRASCNVYHSVLTTDADTEEESPVVQNFPFGAGWALLFLSNEGDFEYQIHLQGINMSLVQEILLQTHQKRKIRMITDITGDISDNWVNGTYGKPTYRDLDALLRERIEIKVILSSEKTLSGMLELVSVTEALRTLHPTLLTSTDTWMAGTAWAAVDEDCVMHYDIRLAGRDPAGGVDPTWTLQLRENDTLWDPRHDQKNTTLEVIVTGREIAAHTTLLTKVSLSRLNYGATYFDLAITSSKTSFEPTVKISGPIVDVFVPSFCLFDSTGNPGAKEPEADVQVHAPCANFNCLRDEVKPIVSTKCIDHEKKVYDDGTTWKSPLNDCARCMCTLSKIKCQAEPCPPSTCFNAVRIPGQCCPSCPVVRGMASEKVCEMDGDYHIIGAFWHPFLAPNGFDKCVTCYCNITWNGFPVVDCQRVACPVLQCSESEATSVDNSCCPQCPPSTPSPLLPAPSKLKGMISEGMVGVDNHRSRDQILRDGGCLERKRILHPNGDVWFPKISPNGVRFCVQCTCKDSNISCVTSSCPESECNGDRKRCRWRKKKYFNKSKKLRRYGDVIKRKRKYRRKKKRERFG